MCHVPDLLSDIFDILAKEYDLKLADQYQGMKATLQASFKLLKAISRGNAAVQGRLFDQLDFLLGVKGAEPEMADAVLEVRYYSFRHSFILVSILESVELNN